MFRYLRWSDLAAEQRRFDLTLARQAVEPLAERALLEKWPVWRLENAVDQEFCWHFGTWLLGWRSGAEGGPVRACGRPGSNPLLEPGQTDPDPTVRRILQAVVEWQEYLEAVELRFGDPADDIRAREAMTHRLLPLVQVWTGKVRGWEETLRLAVDWALESCSPAASPSWEQWRRVRPDPLASALDKSQVVPGERRLLSDGHRDFVERKEDHPGMASALPLARGWARSDKPLTLATLEPWQTALLGVKKAPAARTDGRPWSELETLLAESCRQDADVARRASLVYLDLLAFGPYHREGERLARLALDAVLWREGLGLDHPEPIMLVARGALDRSGPEELEATVRQLAGRCG